MTVSDSRASNVSDVQNGPKDFLLSGLPDTVHFDHAWRNKIAMSWFSQPHAEPSPAARSFSIYPLILFAASAVITGPTSRLDVSQDHPKSISSHRRLSII